MSRGSPSSISNSNSSLNTSSSSVNSNSMNTSSSSALRVTKKSSSTCIACSTENISNSGSNSNKAASGVPSVSSTSINVKGSNSISSADGSSCSSVGVCCGISSGGSVRSVKEVGSPPSSSSLGQRLQEEEAEHGGILHIISAIHASTTRPSSDSFCISSTLCQLGDDSSMNDINAREDKESACSSLEKKRLDTEDTHTNPDPQYRCETTPPPPASRIPVLLSHGSAGHGRGGLGAVAKGCWDGRVFGAAEEKLELRENTTGGHVVSPGKDEPNRTHSPGREEVHRLFGKQRRRSQAIDHFEKELYCSSSSSPSTAEHDRDRRAHAIQVCNQGHNTSQFSASTNRRSKSLERNLAEHTPTVSTPNGPDLLNFKKGWMTRLGEDGKWRKHWFVLTDQSLKFYRDSVAEEAADMDGEINLSTCYDITDFPMQKNYGFQIHTKDGVFTLCAMTYGIRRNWIQAVMKNVRPAVAPDVTCSFSQKVSVSSGSGHKGPSSSSSFYSEERRGRVSERRKEGRYKTFDWAEFRRRQQKREDISRQLGTRSKPVCDDSVPPAPASSPEDHHFQTPHMATPIDTPTNSLPLLPITNHVDPDQSSQLRTKVDDVCVFSDISSARLVLNKLEEEERQNGHSTQSSLPASSSSSVQTDCQWEMELQTLRNQLKAEQERTERAVKDFKDSETRLQAELRDGQDRLCETEARLQTTEATLKEREDVLEELRSHLEEVTGRLKATEEAQALKDARLQRHLRLLQESQERERRSLSDSLEHAEKRGKELEERLLRAEAELQKTPMRGMVEQLERRCQELQNQLEESDSEVSRLQARLCDEETLYYDLEHDYERVSEELERVRSVMTDNERVCEERFRGQLEQQQYEINRKEQELQEVLIKMAALGTSLEETERRLNEAQRHISESGITCSKISESQGLFSGSDIGPKVQNRGQSGLETHPVDVGGESERVVSVIQELESKLSNTEERLREITVHLQQQLATDTHTVCDSPRPSPRTSAEILSADGTGDDVRAKHDSQASHRFQEVMHDKTPSSKVNLETNWMVGDLQGESECPERRLTLGIASRMLSLEVLIIQRMASAVEHPSRELLQRVSELQIQVQALRAQNGNREVAMADSLSQLLAYYQRLDETSCTVGKLDISNLCVKAEMAYLLHTFHLHNSEEEEGLKAFNLSPWPTSKATPLATGSKPKLRLADISPPELAPYSVQIQKNVEEEPCSGDTKQQQAGRESLVAELRAHARSLQALSGQLWHLNGDASMPAELPPAFLQRVLSQATLAYVMSRMRVALQHELCNLREERERAVCECRAMCRSMEAMFQEQTEGYEEKLRENRVVIEMAELGRVSAETDAQMKGQEVQRLEAEFEEKLQELQQIHEEEMTQLHGYLSQSQPENSLEPKDRDENVSVTVLKERIRELETQVTCLEKELLNEDINSVRKAYEQELEALKATCELGFSSMEQSHQRVIEEMQRQHQIEMERLMEEKDRVLQEETNATIAAIDAMRKAHKLELEKNHKVQQNGAGTDISKLCAQYDQELESLHRELEVLSEQYSQKCLENAHLSRTIETERQALSSTERENQELQTRNQELNKCLVTELSIMQSYVNGATDHTQLSPCKDLYQLEVTLRVKESEIQCLKQEICSLKEELQTAHRQSKELLNELNSLGAKFPTDSAKRRSDPYRPRGCRRDLIKSRSNPDLQKDSSKRNTPTRSKSLRDGLSAQERMLLFESDNNKKV